MLIAHIPAGYLLGAGLGRVWPATPRWPALLGSVLPDLGLLYFYTVDQQQVSHRLYWFHAPWFWTMLCGAAVAILLARGRRRGAAAALVLYASLMLHLLLDTVTGPIRWLAPFDDGPVQLFTVPADANHWFVTMATHWTFALEVAIVVTAAAVLLPRMQRLGRACPVPGRQET